MGKVHQKVCKGQGITTGKEERIQKFGGQVFVRGGKSEM